MRKALPLLLLSLLFAGAPLRADSDSSEAKPASNAQVLAQAEELPRFDLDFPGGTPGDLIAAIGKTGKTRLNLVIPEAFSDLPLPSLTMRNASVPELLDALSYTGRNSSGTLPSKRQYFGYEFQTRGTPRSDSIWALNVTSPAMASGSKTTRFYLLTPYLEKGLTVDDLTTAITTSWKMEGLPEKDWPALSFHKETKLLIAVGPFFPLTNIEAVLSALGKPAEASTPKQASEGTKSK